jgi:hypothetical protein
MPRSSAVRRAEDSKPAGLSGAIFDLMNEWVRRAAMLRAHGAEASARSLENAANELQNVMDRAASEALTPRQAAAETGYNRESITRLVRTGRIPNVGRPNAPKVRRADLAALSGARGPRAKASNSPSLASIARDAIATKVTAARGADR